MLIIKAQKKNKIRLGSHNFDANLVHVVKNMINIMYGKHIFNSSGDLNAVDDRKSIKYRDDERGITREIIPPAGWIIFTSMLPGKNRLSTIVRDIEQIVREIGGTYLQFIESFTDVPMSYGSLHPATHGTIPFWRTDKHFDIKVVSRPTEAYISRTSGPSFHLYINMFDDVMDKMLARKGCPRDNIYMYRDLSTIVVDVEDHFSIPNETQLMRALTVEDIRKGKFMVDTPIFISHEYGISPFLSQVMAQCVHGVTAKYLLDPGVLVPPNQTNTFTGEFESKLREQTVWIALTKEALFNSNIDLETDDDSDAAESIRKKTKKKGTRTKKIITVTQDEVDVTNMSKQKALIVALDGSIYKKRRDICMSCHIPLYDTVFIITKNDTSVGCCNYCYGFISGDFSDANVVQVGYPRSINHVLNDPDFQMAMRGYRFCNKPELTIEILKMIVNAKRRIQVDVYHPDEDIETYRSMRSILPDYSYDTEANSNRWLCHFEGDGYDVYMINDTAFSIVDSRYIKENTYLVLGGFMRRSAAEVAEQIPPSDSDTE